MEASLFVEDYRSSSHATTPPESMESSREALGAFGNRSREFARMVRTAQRSVTLGLP
jgi:hypothetical protein